VNCSGTDSDRAAPDGRPHFVRRVGIAHEVQAIAGYAAMYGAPLVANRWVTREQATRKRLECRPCLVSHMRVWSP
jgi:hypothetical protein